MILLSNWCVPFSHYCITYKFVKYSASSFYAMHHLTQIFIFSVTLISSGAIYSDKEVNPSISEKRTVMYLLSPPIETVGRPENIFKNLRSKVMSKCRPDMPFSLSSEIYCNRRNPKIRYTSLQQMYSTIGSANP